jgi:hypothetical protein
MKTETKPSKMKMVLAGAGACFLAAGILFGVYKLAYGSQDAGPSSLTLHPENQEQIICERRANELAGKLNLNAEQTAQVSALVKQLRADGRAVRAQNAGDPQTMIAARVAGFQDFNTKMNALLRPDQQAKYQEVEQNLRGRFGQVLALREKFLGKAQ